ncbi:hypothetical protein ACJX0J_006024 [Zea mays]
MCAALTKGINAIDLTLFSLFIPLDAVNLRFYDMLLLRVNDDKNAIMGKIFLWIFLSKLLSWPKSLVIACMIIEPILEKKIMIHIMVKINKGKIEVLNQGFLAFSATTNTHL